MQKEYVMGKTISVRLPDEIAEKIEQLSNEIHRNKTFIIKSALKKYLEEYADYQIALDRLHDKDDQIISSEEMRDSIEI
jgi:predicted DNA-binding protein